jgi:hypothetical protein
MEMTLSSTSLPQTVETVETVIDTGRATAAPSAPYVNDERPIESPDDNEFLRAIFGEPHLASPVIASFKGNPKRKEDCRWGGTAWTGANAALQDREQNSYFTISSFHRDDKGQVRRSKETFAALHCVVLDDVGTKVGIELIKLEPSWRLETSEGNEQFGYILRDPIADIKAADNLLERLINKGLTDPGANGASTRYMRRVNGVNGKTNPAFVCKLRVWEPGRRYTPEQICDGLGLSTPPADEVVVAAPKRPRAPRPNRSATTSPAPGNHGARRVIAELQKHGLYKGPAKEGRHELTCPWLAGHTDAVDSGTDYFEPNAEYRNGGFKCFHGHCSGRGIHALLDFLGLTEADARQRPTVKVSPGDAHIAVEDTECILASTGKFYSFSGSLAKLVESEKEARLHLLADDVLSLELAKQLVYERFDARSGKERPIDPPANIVRPLAYREGPRHLPSLKALAFQPFLGERGELVSQPGYHEGTQIYGAFDPATFPVPDEPTREDAERSLGKLLELVNEFQFCTEADRTAALVAILTGAVRSSLPLAPMFHVNGSQPGTGKTYLCQLIAAFASASSHTTVSFPTSQEEMAKTILAALSLAPAVLEFDNLSDDIIPHPALCTAITSEAYHARVLGTSTQKKVGTRTLILSSGNNVSPVHDMRRRCVEIRLESPCEIAATRTFARPDLLRDVRANRSAWIAHALTIVKWAAQNASAMPDSRLNGFEAWSSTCLAPLIALGQADPITPMVESMDNSPERNELGQLLGVWHRYFGDTPMKAIEVVAEMTKQGHGPLEEAIAQVAPVRTGGSVAKILGKYLARNQNQPVDGLKLIKAPGGKRSTQQWCVVREPSKVVSQAIAMPPLTADLVANPRGVADAASARPVIEPERSAEQSIAEMIGGSFGAVSVRAIDGDRLLAVADLEDEEDAHRMIDGDG